MMVVVVLELGTGCGTGGCAGWWKKGMGESDGGV